MAPPIEKPKTIKELAQEGRLAATKGYGYENVYASIGWDHQDHYDGCGLSKYDVRDPTLRFHNKAEPINRLKKYQI